MTALRILNLFVWLPLLLAMLPAVWRLIVRQERTDDEVRLTWFLIATVQVCFLTRWLTVPDSETLFAGIYGLSLVAGVAIARVARAYGKSR